MKSPRSGSPWELASREPWVDVICPPPLAANNNAGMIIGAQPKTDLVFSFSPPQWESLVSERREIPAGSAAF